MQVMSDYELLKFLMNSSLEEIKENIEDIHPADILDSIRKLDGDQVFRILSKLPHWIVAEVIGEADEEEQMKLLSLFSELNQGKIVNEMSSDDLADLLGTIAPSEANKLIEKLSSKEDRDEVKELLTYHPETAGGLMATEFLSIIDNMTVEETFTFLQKEAPNAESAYYLYVLDNKEVLKGVVSLRELVTSTFNTQIKDIMNENVISIPVDMDQEEVANKFEKYGFLNMPVVDDNGVILGVITVDDIIDVLREEDTEDIHRLAGIDEEENVDGGTIDSIKSRLPWLFVNLFTALLASTIVSLFEDTISQVVMLAAFMPIVAGMGGNAGTQTLTLVVRGIALGELTYENYKKVLLKEFSVGVINGCSIGIAVAILASIWAQNPIFGLVIGLAMILNMTAATLAGFLVPVTLKKLNVDPALASSVFVTTVTDICGFFFFLGLATVFIRFLV